MVQPQVRLWMNFNKLSGPRDAYLAGLNSHDLGSQSVSEYDASFFQAREYLAVSS